MYLILYDNPTPAADLKETDCHSRDREKKGKANRNRSLDRLDLVDVLVLELDVVISAALVHLIESSDALVEADVLRELSIGLQKAGLIGHVLKDDVGLVVLVVAEADEDDVTGSDPDLLVHLTADMAEPLGAVDAHGLATAVAEHPENLSVLLAVLLEDQLAFLVIGLVLPALAVLPSLTLVLRHPWRGSTETLTLALDPFLLPSPNLSPFYMAFEGW
ncbi:unnamed protein product, partial [Musa acuminata subsp. burmannicoides]